MVTVGFEASLASGSADLVLLDEDGKLCIVEVKKEGNPDTRRVIAQLLDCAAAQWGLTLDEFDRRVLRGKLGADPRSLHVGLVTVSWSAAPPGADRASARERDRCGPSRSSATTPDHAAVPLVGTGTVATATRPAYEAGRGFRDSLIDPETFISSLPEVAQEPVRAFCEDMATAGGELQWWSCGPRVRISGDHGPRVVLNLDVDSLWIVVGPRKGLPTEPGVRAAERLSSVARALVGPDYGRLRWATASADDVAAALTAASEFVHGVVGGAAPADSAG